MVGMQLSRVGRDCLATLEEGSLSSPASQWLRGQGWAEWGVGITGQGSPVYSARTHMGTKRLKGPKGPPLQGIRLGPACSGSLKTSAQFREIGDTLSWTSLAKTEAGSPFSSIFSALKPVWKQHRKTSVTRMSGWVRVRGERVPGPWDQAGTARICPVENHELYRESQRQTPLPPPPFLPPTPPTPPPPLSTAPEQSRVSVSLIHHLSKFQVPSTRQALWASQKPMELQNPPFFSTPAGAELMILPVFPPAY